MKKLFYVYFLVVILTSCSFWSKVSYMWQGRFLKVDTSISKNRWKLSYDERKLADTFYKFDAELDYLANSLQKLSDSNFELISKKTLINRPWVLGVYLFEVINHQVNLKKQVGEKLCVKSDRLVKEHLNLSISSIGLITYKVVNNKIMLVKYQKKGKERYHVTTIVLDIRKLAFYKCNLLQRFAILTNNFIVINNGIDNSDILEIKWNSLIKNKNKGMILTNRGQFYWMVRFLGDNPIFYLLWARRPLP